MKKVNKSTKAITSLKDMIEKVEWFGLHSKRSPLKLADDAVSIQFTHKSVKNTKDQENSDWVRIRFGEEVLKKLGWNIKDTIFVANDPDDHLIFLLFKVESTNGFKLGVETGAASSRLHFSWRDNYPEVKVGSAHTVNYEIHKNKLIFRANV